MTSTGWQHQPRDFAESELARRSRLASFILLGLLVTGGIFLTAGAGDVPTFLAILGGMLGVVIACFFNRAGLITVAAILVTVVLFVAVFGAILSSPGGQLSPDYLPSYDILVLAVVVAGSLLTPAAAFYVAVFNSIAIAVDFLVLQPHSADLTTEINQDGLGLLLGRPIGLEIFVAVVAYLWISGTIAAARRADRAEEIARFEHAFAQQRQQLEIGIQQILNTHVRIANGDFTARPPLSQDNVLWQISVSLNNMIHRLQAASQAQFELERTNTEILRLERALNEARQGKRPIWPAPSRTAVDRLIALFARDSGPMPPAGENWQRQLPPMDLPRFGPNPGQGFAPGFGPGQWSSPGPGSASRFGTGRTPSEPSLPRGSGRLNRPPTGPASPFPPLDSLDNSDRLGGDRFGSERLGPPEGSGFGRIPQWPDFNPDAPAYSRQPPTTPPPSSLDEWPSLQPSEPGSPFAAPDSSSGPGAADGQPTGITDNPWYLPPDE